MVAGQNRIFGCAANCLRGKKCVFCGSFKVNRTRRGDVKCRQGSKQKSLAKLRREIAIIQGFSQQVPAYRLAHDLAVDAKVLSRVYPKLRAAIFHVAELEAMESTLSGESELDEAYFGGRRKGKRGRGAAGKSVVLGLLVGYVSP
jgi:transposase